MSGQGKKPEPSEALAKKSKFETAKVYVGDVDDTRGFLVDLIKNGGHLPPKHGGITAVDQEVHPWSIRLCEARDGGGTEVRSVTYCLDPSDATKRTKYVLNSQAGVAKLIAGRMGVLAEDRAECLGNVAQALLEKHCRGLIKSTPNPLLDQWFHAHNARNRDPHGLLSREKTAAAILKDLQRNKAIYADLNVAHSISMYLPEDDFMSFSHNDAQDLYDGTPVANLPRGMYYVQTDNHTVLRGDGLYTRELLQYAHEGGVDFSIRSMAAASRSMPRDLFQRLLQAVVEHTHTGDLPEGISAQDMRRARKSLRVMVYGMLMRLKTVKYTGAATVNSDNMDEIWQFARSQDVWSGSEWNTLLNIPLDGGQTRVYGVKRQQRMLEHNVAVAFQIQDATHLRLLRMIEKYGGRQLYYCTDAAVLHSPATKDARPEPWEVIDPASLPQMSDEAREELCRWGKYKLAPAPKLLRELTDTIVPAEDVPWAPPAWIDHPEVTDSGDYESITKLAMEHRGLFIEGGWGVGKSFWALRFLEEHPGFLAVAPTHFAATNLDGMTLSALVGHNTAKNTMGHKGLSKDLQRLDGLLVDEVSMIGQQGLRFLSTLKAMKPDLIVIGMGDRQHLPPVNDEEFPYFEHPTWIDIIGGHRITLTRVYRSDARLNAIHAQMLEEGDDFKPDAHFDQNWQQCRRNVSFTNDVADHVNEYWMEKEKPESAVKVLSGGVIETIAWLYPGLPVVSKLTVKRKGADTKGMTLQQAYKAKQLVYNMQRGVVTSVDAEGGKFTVHFSKEGRDLESPMNEFHSGYRVGYCSTTHKAQGETINEHTAVWEWQRMPRRMLNTALSRNTRAEHIHLGMLPAGYQSKTRKATMAAIETKLAGYKASDATNGRPLCDITPKQCYRLLVDADSCCQHCGEEMLMFGWGEDAERRQWTLDRINKRTGGHTRDNVKVAHLSCNENHEYEES